MNLKERVLCVKTGKLHFTPNKLLTNYTPEEFMWVERGTCEGDPTYKQIIPYVILYDYNMDVLLAYTRKGGGDDRLRHLLSIGIGGHINPTDSHRLSNPSLRSTVIDGINRELQEELGDLFPGPQETWWDYMRGYIFDDANAVSADHVGLAFVCPVPLSDDFDFEDEQHKFFLLPFNKLRQRIDEMELWSQIVCKAIFFREKHSGFFRREG